MFAVALNSHQLNPVVFIWSVGLFNWIHSQTRSSLQRSPSILAPVFSIPVIVGTATLNLTSGCFTWLPILIFLESVRLCELVSQTFSASQLVTYTQLWYIIGIVSSCPTHFHSERIGLLRDAFKIKKVYILGLCPKVIDPLPSPPIWDKKNSDFLVCIWTPSLLCEFGTFW